MKTYKTWELLKMAEEIPQREICKSIKDRRQFKNKNNGVICAFGYSKYRGLFDGEGIALKESLLNEEWEEVQQPVTFMEAAKAYTEGKNVKCEYNSLTTGKNVTKHFNHIKGFPKFAQDEEDVLTFYTICNGEWFIEED